MTIEDFLDILEERDLIPKSIVAQLRAKVAKGDRRITAKSVLKYLVKKEYVTQRQAKQLLETTLTVSPHAESSILGMAMTPKIDPPKVDSPKTPPKTKPPKTKTDPTKKSSGKKNKPEQPVQPEQPAEEAIPILTPVDASPPTGDDPFAENPSVDAPSVFDDDLSSLASSSLSQIGSGKEEATLGNTLEEKSPSKTTTKKHRQKKKRDKDKSEWDSSLLLLGTGGLILLLLGGGAIWYLLNRENADEILAEATSNYESAAYPLAIKQFQRVVDNHPNHPDHSAAVVKLGLAKLWNASSSATYSTEAWETAQQVLAEIDDEEEFNSAQRELASLLPQIAQGLATQAEKAKDLDKIQSLVKQTNAALAFCKNTKYFPKSFQDGEQLGKIDQTLQRVERARAQNAALGQTMADIQQALDAHNMAQAYQLHDKLLDEHPGLINNEQLSAKILEISTAEAAVVKYVNETQAATTEPRPTQVVAELALANRSGPTVAGVEGTVAVRVSGAIYGLNLADGALRWHRFVGIAPRLTPLPLPSGDILVVDSRYHELLKISATTGKLIWRQAFASAITRPVLLGDKILVGETIGKLHILDAANGQRQGYVQFAQRLSASPAVGMRGTRIYLTGEHSSLYTLSTEDFSCLGVFFLNHAKGSVTTPPITVLNKVIVAVAKGLSTTRLEVLSTTAEGIPNQRATSKRLEGLVNTKLLSQGRRLVVLTSRGQIGVYEVSSGSGEGSLTKIASRDSISGSQIARFGFLNNSQLWVAGEKLNKLGILPTSDRLPSNTIDRDYQGDSFDHPLQAFGDLLIHVRQPANQAGAIVAAMKMKSGEPQWETVLAAMPAGPPAADATGKQINTLTATGLAFQADRRALRSRLVNQAFQVSIPRKTPPFTHSLDLGQGRLLASTDESQTLLLFNPNQTRRPLNAIRLAGPASCAPIIWDDDFIVPTQTGQVFLYSSKNGQSWGTPFQPALEPGVQYNWLSPAVYGSGPGSRLVLSDGSQKIYLVGRVDQPQPHLKALASVDLSTAPLNTRFAIVGDVAMAGAEDNSLAAFQLPSLASLPSTDLQAQVTWGPYTVGQHVLLATSSDELICFNAQAKISWRQPFTHGPPAGKPIASEESATLLWQQGGLSRLQLSDGTEAVYSPLPQPTVAGPVPFGKRLVVSTSDGTLLIVDRP